MPSITGVKAKIECTILKITWNPPDIHPSCQLHLGYRVNYKIYSAEGVTSWKIVCNNTRKTNCDILLDREQLGMTLIFNIVALVPKRTTKASSYYYRVYPTLSCEFMKKC